MEEQKLTFYDLLDKYVSGLAENKRQAFYCDQEKYNKIEKTLKLRSGEKCADGAKFKYLCQKHYKLETIGSRTIVYCKKTELPIVTKAEIFETVANCHINVGHSGRDKTWSEVTTHYSGIKYETIDIFLKTCQNCKKRQPARNPPTGKPIISLSCLQRVQIDLIDFRNRHYSDYSWILHARDHFSKFSWAYPMKTKTAKEVASLLLTQFCAFGPPKILQSDNGAEFTAKVIRELANLWPEMVIIRGRPRHPESQGIVIIVILTFIFYLCSVQSDEELQQQF